MTTKNSSKKRVDKQTTKGEGKRCKHSVIQQHEEIISKEELEQRGGGIIDETKAYLSLLLRCFYEGHIICCQIKTIRSLAQFIYKRQNDLCESYKSFCFISNLLTQNDMYILN